jgi:hypothetical protein
VVEFDVQRLLREAGFDDVETIEPIAGQTSGIDSELSSIGGLGGIDGVGEVGDVDDDIRAAVQAAIAEIEAAARGTVDSEAPSILMQAALDDAERHASAPDVWDVSSPAHTDDAEPAADTSTTPEQPPRPVLPPRVTTSQTTTEAEPAPSDSPSPTAPATGGLRRLMGSRKP